MSLLVMIARAQAAVAKLLLNDLDFKFVLNPKLVATNIHLQSKLTVSNQ